MVNAFSFSYTPKPSTALAAITPLKLLGEGRESLRFTASTPMSFIKQNPEVVTEGFWKGRQALTEGIVKGTTSALSGVAGALTSKAAETKADTDAETTHNRAIAIAKIKAAPTLNEEIYKSNQLAIQNEQLRKFQTENNNVDTTQDDTVAEGDTSIIDEIDSLISPAAKAVESATQPAPAPAPAPVAPPAAPVVSNAPVAPAGVRPFAPGDATKGLFQFDQGTGTDAFGNMPPRQSSMAFNLAPIPQTEAMVAAAPAAVPAVTQVAPKSVFGQSTNGLVPLRETLKKTEAISGTAPVPAPPPALVLSELTLPESVGEMTLNDDTIQLMPVSGAEGVIAPKTAAKPLEGTPPPPVEPALPQKVPSEPTLATPEPVPERTQEEIINEYVGLLTNKAYRGAGDARRAKQVLEKLGLKAQIETEKGEKGSRLHYVKVVDEAPPAKTAPEGYYTESIRDANGNETYVYKPKVPVKQQIATFDNGIKKANVLKETLDRIKKIAPSTFGITGGAGGISGLMKYNPIANDARTTRALLDTVKGIVGFDELVALKQQGGSLGALSDSELKMLTSLQGSIDPDMDEKTFMDNINKMSESTAKLIAGLEDDKKQVTNVENKTNFQPIQSEKPKNEKDKVYIINGSRYKWDGNEYKLIQ